MRTVEIKIYTYSELSDAAKEKARDWYRESRLDDNCWSESVIDEAVETGKSLGIEFSEYGDRRTRPCIWWSGFSSQGDGACFEGKWDSSKLKADNVAEGWGDSPETTEIKNIAKALAREVQNYPFITAKVKHSGRYYHALSVSIDVNITDPQGNEIEYGEAERSCEEQIKELLRHFMRWIYRMLENAYNDEQSDECVSGNITANEYTFTESGKRFG